MESPFCVNPSIGVILACVSFRRLHGRCVSATRKSIILRENSLNKGIEKGALGVWGWTAHVAGEAAELVKWKDSGLMKHGIKLPSYCTE